MIDYIQKNKNAHAIILNPGGLTTVGFPLLDALIDSEKLSIEVHISDIHKREEFRKNSFLSDISIGCIIGCGVGGYGLAMRRAKNYLRDK